MVSTYIGTGLNVDAVATNTYNLEKQGLHNMLGLWGKKIYLSFKEDAVLNIGKNCCFSLAENTVMKQNTVYKKYI